VSRQKSKTKAPVKPVPGAGLSRRRLWFFRFIAMVIVPFVLIGLLELGLRVAGFGYPTAFLLPSRNHEARTFVQNNQFGWRFFGPRMSRLPHAISITQKKSPGTIRIFVFGESAAFGDPEPLFGLPRMLQATLEWRHPGMKFEVVNAAMTAINSHTIVPIARDCARADGDVWVVYMGNNEVVGPYGAGTIFGPQAPALPIIRASLALKATCTGQLLGSLLAALQPPPPSKSEWGGMEMFLDQRIRVDDRRMLNVYRNFQQNLADIIRLGHDSGAGVVVSTVAVNLKDCAPFASLHRATLSAGELKDWEAAVNRGVAAQQAGNIPEAQTAFRAASALDDTFAELRFRLGQCAFASADPNEARKQFIAAKDLDALRFRCDSQLNDLTRQTCSHRESDRVLFADAEAAFAASSQDGLPGADLFYEHVHPTFAGNFILARTLAEQVEKLLPTTAAANLRPWPEIADCARRLAYTGRATQSALSKIIGRASDPPFTWQLNHTNQEQRLAEQARALAPEDSPNSLREAQSACESAIAASPDDALLYQQLAELKQAGGDHAGAAAAVQRCLDLLPSDSDSWLLLGLAQAEQQKYEESAAAFRKALALYSQDVWARQNLAMCLRKMGRRDEAIGEFKRTVAIKPRFGLAWLGLGQAYEEMGRNTEAMECYNKALANPIHRTDELVTLARFCESRKWFAAASTNFAEAIQLSPSNPELRVDDGRVLVELGRHTEAAQRFAEASQLAPDSGAAHFLYGLELGRLGRPAEAEPEFRAAARLMPNLAEPQLNLGIALYQQKKFGPALDAFHETLQRDPANVTALKYVQALTPGTQSSPGK
jgi:tetratricopeptide (TPR) repeat protein